MDLEKAAPAAFFILPSMNKIEIKVEQVGVGRLLDNLSKSADKEIVKPEASGRKVAITTLGCKINSYESELISQALQTENWAYCQRYRGCRSFI